MKSIAEKRAELVELLGEEKVSKYEREFDEYVLFGTREARAIGEPKGLFEPKETKEQVADFIESNLRNYQDLKDSIEADERNRSISSK